MKSIMSAIATTLAICLSKMNTHRKEQSPKKLKKK
jgi:hypothetical protein